MIEPFRRAIIAQHPTNDPIKKRLMKAFILAGGLGTRLRPFTASIPKPLLPLGDTPIVEVVLQQLASNGFEHVTIALNHLAPLFHAVVGDGKRLGLKIEYVLEDHPLGTAGALSLLSEVPDDILVMNGDVLTTLDFADLYRSHKDSGATASVAVSQREVYIDYGVLDYDSEGWLSKYTEKPSLGYSVSMGIYILSRKAVAAIPDATRYDIPTLLQDLMSKGESVRCYPTDCYWQDIGRVDDYETASTDFTENPDQFI